MNEPSEFDELKFYFIFILLKFAYPQNVLNIKIVCYCPIFKQSSIMVRLIIMSSCMVYGKHCAHVELTHDKSTVQRRIQDFCMGVRMYKGMLILCLFLKYHMKIK